MRLNQLMRQYRWLAGSLFVWLLCAGIARQPSPTHKKSVSVVRKKAVPSVKTSLAKTGADSLKTDLETGLALDKNLMLVKGQCTACHSSKLILQSHFDRDKWVERIRWMQRTQKLWDLGESEKPILDYLTAHYGPIKTPFDGRRFPLDAPKWHTEAGR